MILTLTTNQITALKTCFQVLDSLISEVNLEISRTGIVIREVNKSSKLLVSINLPEENFDTYEYTYGFDVYNLGIDVSSITQRLKTPLKYDSLTLLVTDSGEAKLKLENFIRKEKKTFKLKTTTSCPVTCCEITPVEYSVCVTLSSDLLNKYTKELNNSCETFTLTASPSTLEFSNTDTSYTLTESKFLSILSEDTDFLVTTNLISTYFCIFSKLGNLSESVTIFLSENTFTSCRYSLGSLGFFTIVLL